MVAFKPTVLFVEDSDLDFELADSAIRRLGWPVDVLRVSSESEFVSYMQSVHDCPSLIVMDIRLPDGSGLELTRRLRIEGPCQRIPLVVFSTSIEADGERATRYGANEVAVKPFEPGEFVLTVQSFVSRWLAFASN